MSQIGNVNYIIQSVYINMNKSRYRVCYKFETALPNSKKFYIQGFLSKMNISALIEGKRVRENELETIKKGK